MDKKRIYFIGDDFYFLVLLKKYFTAQGYELSTFTSGIKGLRAYEKLPPALLITDIYMPDLDGVDLMRSIRAINPQAKVFTMTAFEAGTFIDPLEVCRQLGSQACFHKPFDFREMRQRIEECLKSA